MTSLIPFLSMLATLAALFHSKFTGHHLSTSRQPTVILFVGNSFFHGDFKPVLTYNANAISDENYQPNRKSPRRSWEHKEERWGGIPGIFKRLTDEAGLNYEVHLEAASGYTLQFHYDSVLAVIKEPRWNTVVLHEQSMRPIPTRRGGQPSLFFKYANLLEQAIHHANPVAKVYLYETWARADLTFPANQPYTGLPLDSMTSELHSSYQAATRYGHFTDVAPVGDAWLRAVHQGVALHNPYVPEKNGKVDLWATDHFHPSNYGAYLSACVLLETITGYNPRKLGRHETAAAELYIEPEVAERLQSIAHEQVRNH